MTGAAAGKPPEGRATADGADLVGAAEVAMNPCLARVWIAEMVRRQSDRA